MNEHAFTCQNERVVLLAEKALWWKCQSCVFVADIHLGKPSSFRASGIPIPEGSDAADLGRLSAILDHTKAGELCILGDLIHNLNSLTKPVIEAFGKWRQQHSGVKLSLTIGNHDRHAPKLVETLRIDECGDRLLRGPFVFQHEPEPSPDGYVIAGHVHPGVHVSDKQERCLKLACCLIGGCVMTLPAFGTFTGTQRIRAAEGDRVVAFAEGGLIEVPWRLCS